MKVLTIKSKTINWGHIQFIGGLLLTIIPFVNKQYIPNISPSIVGGVAIFGAALTYILRNVTVEPLDKK